MSEDEDEQLVQAELMAMIQLYAEENRCLCCDEIGCNYTCTGI